MKIGKYDGKIMLIQETGEEIKGCDVQPLLGGKADGDMLSVFSEWEGFNEKAKKLTASDFNVNIKRENLEATLTNIKQIFAVGLNYVNHVAELNMDMGKPDVFTKFYSSIGNPYSNVKRSGDTVDWEVELVAVIVKGGRNIKKEDALKHVAGYMIGQDFSDRTAQYMGSAKQFSLGKSYEGYSPIGPWITTLDELKAPLDLEIKCTVNGEVRQESRTSMMLENVDTIIEFLSKVVMLYPGDIIFTGTPGGVGVGRNPQVFLKTGDVVLSEIEGLGFIRQEMV